MLFFGILFFWCDVNVVSNWRMFAKQPRCVMCGPELGHYESHVNVVSNWRMFAKQPRCVM